MRIEATGRGRARALGIALAVALISAAVVAATARTPAMAQGGSGDVPCETVAAPDVSFGAPVVIDEARAGGEPVSVIAKDGSINVSAHAGTTHIYKDPLALPGAGDFAVGYFNQTLNWRSTDGGATWKYVGFAGQPVGPHSATSTGFSDPDFAIDQAGNIYNVEIDLANDSVFKSTDDGQSYPIANPVAGAGDRPWLTALEPDEVFLYINLPKMLRYSTDPLLVQWQTLPTPPISSKAMPDPLNPNDGLIGPVGLGKFAISGDDARTWKTHSFGPLGKSTQFFGVVAVDRAGNVYQAAAGGYEGPDDTSPSGEVTFTYYERATGRTNSQLIELPIPPGDALWPWIVAGDDGRVAVAWYQNHAGAPNMFYAYAGITHNGLGTEVKCSDGTTKHVPPQFDVENVSGKPIHVGAICLEGTACNAERTFEGGDRRLGDFYSINFDLEGNVFIASADTTLPNPLGGPKPVGNPIFVKQSSGPKLLGKPIPPRPTPP
ncbi:MAG TPA: hypothetical protein VM266_04375, partial [Solirubrobacteraceae bacterium]|nr:hypothetical protein [Solirubrobacteraceae bacterium]